MRRIDLQGGIGDDLWTTLATTLTKSSYEVFKEFASNSYDADAENVGITVNTIDDILVIEDDGSGMNEETIHNFYQMGDSEKRESPITPKGRNKIGQFGIATVLLQSVGDAYTLETWRDGRKITIDEEFGEVQEATQTLPYRISRSGKDDHGTRLTFRGLRFARESTFKLSRLEHVLTWEMPISDDFSITVNGKELKKKPLKPTASYHFESELENAGLIVGDFHYFGRKAPTAGIYVYINGRAVGDPDQFDLRRVSRLLPGKLLGSVYADGLRDHISFDRSRLQENSLAVREVKSEVYRQLRLVRKDIEALRTVDSAKEVQSAVPEALEHTQKWGRQVSIPQIVERVKSRVDQSDTPQYRERRKVSQSASLAETSELVKEDLGKASERSRNGAGTIDFTLVDRDPTEGMATFDSESGVVYINAGHPCFRILKTRARSRNLHLQFVYAASNAIAGQMTVDALSRDSTGVKLLEEREAQAATMAERVYGIGTTLVDKLVDITSVSDRGTRINPHRTYRKDELLELTGWPVITLRKLESSGILSDAGAKGLYLGSDIISTSKSLGGYTPAWQLVRDHIEATKPQLSRQRVEQLYGKIDGQLLDAGDEIEFIHNIGVNDPFFVVENGFEDRFITLYTKRAFRKGGMRGISPELMRKVVSDSTTYVTLYEATDRFGIPFSELMGAFGAAMTDGSRIRTDTRRGVQIYNVQDLRKICIGE